MTSYRLKSYLLFLFALVLMANSSYAQKTPYQTGTWADKCTWYLLCGLSGNAPISTDNVTINGGKTVTVNSNVACNNLTVDDGSSNSILVIAAGKTLTINGNLTLTANNLIFNGDIANSVKSKISVLGTLIVKGDIIFNNTSYFSGANVYISQAQILIGDASNAGTLTAQKSILMNSGQTHVSTVFNQIGLLNGTINVTDSVVMGTQAASKNTGINNFAIYDGFGVNKTLNVSGVTPISHHQGTFSQAEPTGTQTDCITNFLTTGDFEIYMGPEMEYGTINVPNADTITISDNTTSAQILGNFNILSGQTLKLDDAAVNLDGAAAATNFNLNLATGSTLLLKNAAIENGIPANKVSADPSSTIIFNNTTATSYDIFLETLNGASTEYPDVILLGSGVKYISASSAAINNTDFKVGNIHLQEGTLAIANASTLHLNDSYGDKFLIVDSATTVLLEGDFTSEDFYGDFHRYSTWEYNKDNATQSLYEFTSDGSTVEPYGILKLTTLSGTNVSRTVTSKEVLVENRLEVGNNINLNLNNNGYIHLLSDVQYTAYVAEVPASASINYSGTGNFIVDKYMGFTGYTAADVAHPIAGATLENYKNNGVSMGGFPGSNSPGQRFASVSTYTESELGGLNTGFNKPESIDDSFLETDGASRVTRSTYRMNIPAGNIHLSDTGNVNTGDYTFKITFNFSDTDADSRTANDGYNLIGNPFPANLDWSKVVNDPANKPLFDNGYILPYVYVYKYFDRVEQEPTGTSGYGYYNPNTNFQFAQDSIIPSHQGFWVKAFHPTSASETYELVIRESHKIDFEESRNYKNGTAPKNTKDIAAKISLESAGRFDQMYFHTWKKANLAFDKALDIKTYGAKRATSGFLDFADENNERLELYVNAVPENLNGTTLPIYTNIAKPGTHTLTLSNLSNILKNYSCSYILDTQTSEKTSLTDSLSISFTAGPFAGVRFVLVFNQDLSAKITTENLSCEDANNGRVEMNLTGIAGAKDYSLFLNGANLKNYTGTYTKILEENLAPGNYQLVNNSGLITCSENTFDFVIANAEPLVATIDKSLTDVFVNDRVSFNANGNADVYNWVFKGVNYPGATFVHTFQAKGKYTLKLQYADKTLNCADETSETIEVQELATGVTAITTTKGILFKNGIIQFEENSAFKEIQIYSLSGQLIELINIESNTRSILLPKGVNIVVLVKKDNSSLSYTIGNL